MGGDTLQEDDDEPKRGWIPALVIGSGLLAGLALVAVCAGGGVLQAVTGATSGAGGAAVAEGTPPPPAEVAPVSARTQTLRSGAFDARLG